MPQNDSASEVYYQIRDPEEQAVSKKKWYGHSEIAATAYDRLSHWKNERGIDENKPLSMEEVCEKLYQAEKEIKAGMTADARQSLEELCSRYSL